MVDIALIELDESLTYSAMSFNIGNENGVELKKLVGGSKVQGNDNLYSDSPFNGKYMETIAFLLIWES